CVKRNRELFESGQQVQAVVVNSGIANTATGEQGTKDNLRMAREAASQLGLGDVNSVLTGSTGVVGVQLPIDGIEAGLPGLVENLGDDSSSFAAAIITTDKLF